MDAERKIQTVSVFGGGKGIDEGHWAYTLASEIGFLLAERKIIVRTGAGSGVMEATARGAVSIGGEAQGCYLWDRQPNPYQKRAAFHAASMLPPANDENPERQWGVRLGHLLEADAFIAIMADPTSGTLVEVFGVVNLNQKLWSPKRRLVTVGRYSPVQAEFPDLYDSSLYPHFRLNPYFHLSAETIVETLLAS